MSGINERAITAQYLLRCEKCSAEWASPVMPAAGWSDSRIDVCRSAFDEGWSIWVGQRGQHTYCPQHGPSVPMRLVHGGAA